MKDEKNLPQVRGGKKNNGGSPDFKKTNQTKPMGNMERLSLLHRKTRKADAKRFIPASWVPEKKQEKSSSKVNGNNSVR